MPATAASATILVVDDDQSLLRLIERTLRRGGFSTETVTSGQAAIDWRMRHHADLMLLDLKLQDIGGKELIDHLASIGRLLPFIIITGQGDERVAVEMMKRGALDYLVKDTQFAELLPAVVQRALAQIETEKRLTAAEEALGKSEALKQAVMHSLTAHIAVLDGSGNIIALNEAWNRFAHLNGVTGLAQTGVGSNYLEACRRAAAGGAVQASQALVGIQEVLAGSRNEFSLEYDCHGPGTERWFVMLVTPLGPPGGGTVISHTDVTERKKLEKSLLDLTEREQRKFGHDLHDGLGQRLTGLEMLSHALAEDIKSQAPPLAKRAERLNRELRETVTQARLLSHSLAPVPLEGEGLMRALFELAASTSRIPRVKCQFHCEPPVSIQDPATATHLYRIAQEAVNNALKHGQATKIKITLAERNGTVHFSVENNGRPMPVAIPANSGTGLHVMRYRARMIDASLSIEPGQTKGVNVVCIVRRKI
jgi:signal transduction histidine kinase